MDISKERTISPQDLDVDEEATESQQASMASTFAEEPDEGLDDATAVGAVESASSGTTHPSTGGTVHVAVLCILHFIDRLKWIR